MKLSAQQRGALASVNRRLNDARRLTTRHPIPLDRPQAAPLILVDDRRPAAPDREPCHRCGTRGDLGCAHQAPFAGGARAGTVNGPNGRPLRQDARLRLVPGRTG